MEVEEILENEIIETDADTIEQDADEGGLYPYDPTKEDIDVREEPQTVYELVVRKWDRNLIKIDPEFQRNFVWKLPEMSQFIESIILNFPIPPLYLNQNREGELIVVDGRQRLTTLRKFIKNEFVLQDLQVLRHLNGKKFADLASLSGGFQAKIEDKKLLVFLIKPSVSLKVVYDIFYRINTGGTQLERQEIRHCIFQGKSTELLKELSQETYFKEAIGYGIKPDRMKDREAVLRYLAFRILPIESYTNMSDFVETAMKKINKFNDIQIQELKEEFEYTMTTCYELFGENNFRMPTEQTRGRINIAVMESVSLFISKYFKQERGFPIRNADIIWENFWERLLETQEYLDATRFATGSKQRVINRFSLAESILSENTH